MSESVIKVRNLGKKYNLKHLVHQKGEDLLIGSFSKFTKGVFKNSQSEEDFWALQDVSFEIKKGDRVGIIGRNGAGKSTLLKILSRIVQPTTGSFEFEGRIVSLLEVGTGFHGDLTGRENIFLNGSILGMSRKEIEAKFDEIVAFSEIEKFLDTPVKRYSSGMYVRLAFSVAAHLEPDILIIDEVLAVGDSLFQKKCIDKLSAISKQGRTVLFVSHNFSAVESLCNSAILLEKGRIVKQGSVLDVFNCYNSNFKMMTNSFNLLDIDRSEYAREVIFSRITFDEMPLRYGAPLNFNLYFKSVADKKFKDIDLGVNICNPNYQTVYHVSNRFIHKTFDHECDEHAYRFEIENNLKPGEYYLVLFLRANDVIQDFLTYNISFEIMDGNPYGFNDSSQFQGIVLPNFNVKVVK